MLSAPRPKTHISADLVALAVELVLVPHSTIAAATDRALCLVIEEGAVAGIVDVFPVIGGIQISVAAKTGIGAGPEVDAVHRVGRVGAVDVKAETVIRLLDLVDTVKSGRGVPSVGQYRGERLAVVLVDAVRVVEVGADGELLVGIDIRKERRDAGCGGTAHAEADETVLLDFGGGDDVDDAAAALGAVAGRRVGDDLDLLDAAGGHLLDELLERLGVHIGGLVVDPNLHGRDAAQGDVALHVHLHAGGVLQGIRRRARLYGGVLGHVVERLLAIHHIDGFLPNNLHLLQVGAVLVHRDVA